MAGQTIPDLDALRAEMAELRQNLDSLARMAQQGLPVAEAQAQARERLAALEAQIVALGDVHGDLVSGTKVTTIDQREQQVQHQVNVAHLYQVYQAAPGRAELTEEAFQRCWPTTWTGWSASMDIPASTVCSRCSRAVRSTGPWPGSTPPSSSGTARR